MLLYPSLTCKLIYLIAALASPFPCPFTCTLQVTPQAAPDSSLLLLSPPLLLPPSLYTPYMSSSLVQTVENKSPLSVF